MTGALSGSREPDPSSTGSGPSRFDPERFARRLREAAAYVERHTDSHGEEPYYSCQMAIASALSLVAEAMEDEVAAIAMEARQGGDGETRLHPKDDSAGPKDIAQPQPPSPSE